MGAGIKGNVLSAWYCPARKRPSTARSNLCGGGPEARVVPRHASRNRFIANSPKNLCRLQQSALLLNVHRSTVDNKPHAVQNSTDSTLMVTDVLETNLRYFCDVSVLNINNES